MGYKTILLKAIGPKNNKHDNIYFKHTQSTLDITGPYDICGSEHCKHFC